MKIAILGSTGMLGWTVGQHFIQKFGEDNVYLSYRSKANCWGYHKFFFDATASINSSHKCLECDYVINCIGVIKPYAEKDIQETVLVNSLFPRRLADLCSSLGKKLIHITTDCVFSGQKGSYTEDDSHDALDGYGTSKSLGEPQNCLTIRTSIIGEELHGKVSLVEWTKSQKGKKVSGYTNHYWNGVTTNTYAEICERIIQEDLYQEGVFHVFSPTVVTKYALLSMLNSRFDLNLDITPVVAGLGVDRSLSTVKDFNSKLYVPEISEQINRM